MDELKPEDDLKADRSDRRTGRSRQSSERDSDPQINFDDVDLDADDSRPTRASKARRERDEEEYEADVESEEDEESKSSRLSVVRASVRKRPRSQPPASIL
jgi:DamX protein